MRFVKVCLSVGAVCMAGCANLGGPANGGGSGDDGDEAVLGSLEEGECRDASHCNDNEFCLFDEGVCETADGVGVCAEIVDICTEEYAPVCGCDGQTYGNACFAHAAGTSVAERGTCEGDPGESAFCGGLAGVACPDDQFCLFEEGTCGAADQAGTCTDVPDFCTEEFAPVCGCNDQTYANECFAYAAGVSLVQRGACEDVGDGNICGGIAGLACPDAEFCLFEEGTCGAADQTGACVQYPEACTEQFEPVCGCDDQTYDNECFAFAAGVSIVQRSACP